MDYAPAVKEAALTTVIGAAQAYLEDLTTGVEQGYYSRKENDDAIADLEQALAIVEQPSAQGAISTDELVAAAKRVVRRWAHGDLAEAVRELADVLRMNDSEMCAHQFNDDNECIFCGTVDPETVPPPTEGQRASREATARMGIIPGMNDDDDDDTAGTVSVEVSHPYLISDNVGRMFWSNVDGWVERGSATRFTREERQTMRLPLGGYWAGDDE